MRLLILQLLNVLLSSNKKSNIQEFVVRHMKLNMKVCKAIYEAGFTKLVEKHGDIYTPTSKVEKEMMKVLEF